MPTNKKAVSGFWPISRVFLIAAAVLIILIALFFTWQFYANRPNYRDLKKEYSKLVIPSNWVLESRNDEKGVAGLFCWGIDNSSCPNISSQYNSKDAPNPVDDKALLNNIVKNLGYEPKIEVNNNCVVSSTNYSCSARGVKNNYAIVVSVGFENNINKKIMTILLGQKSGIGIN
jgi:hypothetical protein